jgi:hypothetical protein
MRPVEGGTPRGRSGGPRGRGGGSRGEGGSMLDQARSSRGRRRVERFGAGVVRPFPHSDHFGREARQRPPRAGCRSLSGMQTAGRRPRSGRKRRWAAETRKLIPQRDRRPPQGGVPGAAPPKTSGIVSLRDGRPFARRARDQTPREGPGHDGAGHVTRGGSLTSSRRAGTMEAERREPVEARAVW